MGHDGYLKLWALGRPKLAADFVLLDEAQDSNPVMLDVLSRQAAQVVYVGDRHQQIYQWRGANPDNLLQLGSDYPALRIVKLSEPTASKWST